MTATIKITAAALLSPQNIDTKMPIYAQNYPFLELLERNGNIHEKMVNQVSHQLSPKMLCSIQLLFYT